LLFVVVFLVVVVVQLIVKCVVFLYLQQLHKTFFCTF